MADKNKEQEALAGAAEDFLNSEAGQGYEGMGADQFAPVFISCSTPPRASPTASPST
jgi:hypothetical protein